MHQESSSVFCVASFENVHVHLFKITERKKIVQLFIFKWKQYGLGEGWNPGQAGMTCMMIAQYMAWKHEIQSAQKNSLIYFSLVSNGISR